MKFLMNKFILSLLFFSFLYTLDCFSSWHKDNFDSQKGVYFISGLINKNNHFKLFIKNDQNNQKYRIDLIDKIIEKITVFILSELRTFYPKLPVSMHPRILF